MLAKIIDYQGQRSPIVVSKRSGFITKGHGRLMAIKKLGWTKCAVDMQDYENEAQEYSDVVADNKIAELAEHDDMLMLEGIKELGIDNFELLGLDGYELPEVEVLEPQCDEDHVPEQVDTRCKKGDVWLLGNHRLMCGDSTSIDAVEKLMDGNSPNIMMTDPPYGVNLDQSWRDKALGDKALGKGNAKIVSNDDEADWTDVYALFKGNIAYIWHASKFTDVVMRGLRDCGLEPNQQLIWNKSVMVMGRCDYHFKHEPCWYAVRKGKPHDWIGDRKQVTVIEAAPPNHIMGGSKEEKTSHPTQKPLACMELISNNKGDVYDPFGGSGSTLIACEKTNRKCFMMELDEHYCDVILSRWEKYTGKKATLWQDQK